MNRELGLAFLSLLLDLFRHDDGLVVLPSGRTAEGLVAAVAAECEGQGPSSSCNVVRPRVTWSPTTICAFGSIAQQASERFPTFLGADGARSLPSPTGRSQSPFSFVPFVEARSYNTHHEQTNLSRRTYLDIYISTCIAPNLAVPFAHFGVTKKNHVICARSSNLKLRVQEQVNSCRMDTSQSYLPLLKVKR